ncbi:type IV pilus biogenesis protein PilM [Paraliobacillus ryukyuensis]|uniref:type IV pilus biogenesis protein PilM n=1 Tax=Paraliobacillus ryukyuensis TaxID=200904 RepID=UPI0009A77E26|nr:pilus assembly protein PilM [Paraliobacillus ryukyuensis]
MQLFTKDTVNLMLTDTVLRYLHEDKKGIDYGEIELDPGLIEDGKIIDKVTLLGMVRALINDKKWKRKNIAICVPDAFVTLREETVPMQLTQEEIKKYIYFELNSSIRLPFKDPVIDFASIEETNEGRRILLFAYPKERLQSYIALFEEANCKLTVADLSFLSVYRVFKQFELTRENEHLLLVQWRKTDLVLTVFHANRPIFNRHIHLSRFDFVESIETTDEFFQEVIEEQFITIERFLDFYQYSIMNNEAQINSILLTGDFPNLPYVNKALNERFNLPVQTLDSYHELPAKYAELSGLSLKSQ